MKMKNRDTTQDSTRVQDLWALLVLFVVVGAYLATWIILLILKAA
ncbi:MAG TPA: hypothetical protein VET88_03045 [Gammaproteobacteria bacterium]|nr:hypothetical protein [Gammaproteobacteria bacterium]